MNREKRRRGKDLAFPLHVHLEALTKQNKTRLLLKVKFEKKQKFFKITKCFHNI